MHNIVLSDAAAEHIKAEIQKAPNKIIGVKFGVTKTGCSGYAYLLDFISSEDKLDNSLFNKFTSHDIDIYVDKKSYSFVAGTKIDYVKQNIGSIMMFDNPNATAECGCGESFTVDQDKNNPN